MRTIPRNDAQFVAFAKNMAQRCTANRTEWQLDEVVVEELSLLTAAADNAYAANLDKETRNHATCAAKDGAFKELRAALSAVVGALRYNAAVPADALISMGLPPRVRHARQPIPAPSEAPQVITLAGTHSEVIVFVRRPSHGHPEHSLHSSKHRGFMLQWRFMDSTEWTPECSTTSRMVLRFEEEFTGKTILVQAAWLNPRMQRGPWSRAVSAIVN